MNWYFVFNGEVRMRAEEVPLTFQHPDGKTYDLNGATLQDLAMVGWLQGQPPEVRHEYDDATEKCVVIPQMPGDLVEWQTAWADLAASMKKMTVEERVAVIPPQPPMVAEVWVKEALSPVELEAIRILAFREVRWRRDMLLMGTDFYFTTDPPPLSDDAREALREYRQKLRDLPSTFDDPKDVKWPEPPVMETEPVVDVKPPPNSSPLTP